jgi:predicted transcriptional regulator
MIEEDNTFAGYINRNINRIAEKLIRENKEEIQDKYFLGYIKNSNDSIEQLQKMYDNAQNPLQAYRSLIALKQSKKELAEVSRQYNQIKRQRQQRQKHVS